MAIVYQEHDALTGITSKVHKTETRTVIEKTYDAEPLLEAAKVMRANTAGDSWGEFRHVGFVPMAELGTMLRQDGRLDKKRMLAWIKANPALCTFERLLK